MLIVTHEWDWVCTSIITATEHWHFVSLLMRHITLLLMWTVFYGLGVQWICKLWRTNKYYLKLCRAVTNIVKKEQRGLFKRTLSTLRVHRVTLLRSEDLLPSANEVAEGNVFTSVSRILSTVGEVYTPLGRHPLSPLGRRPPEYGYCRGRYASYWNAFLLTNRTVEG